MPWNGREKYDLGKWQWGKPFPPVWKVGFRIQTSTPRVVTAAPSFACFDELIMLITSDTEHEQMLVFVLSVKAALSVRIPKTWQYGGRGALPSA